MEYDPFLSKIRFNKNESKKKKDRFELNIENRKYDELCAFVALECKDDSIAIINSPSYKFDRFY